MTRSMVRSRRRKENPWLDIQDMIGSADAWPKFIRKLFWRSDLKYKDRLLLVAFGWNNGVSPHLLYRTLRFTGPLRRNPKAEKEMDSLYQTFDNEKKYRCKYYSYDLTLGRMTFLNGDTKPKPKKSKENDEWSEYY